MHQKLFLFLSLLLSVGCAQLPLSDEFQSSALSKAGDYLLKKSQKSRNDQTSEPTLRDEAANSYIAALGNRLLKKAHTNSEIEFKIINTPYIQAHSSGIWGEILVTRGMLNFIKNEAELAALLGHEIGHIKLNHQSTGFKDQSRLLDDFIDEAERKANVNLNIGKHRYDIAYSNFNKNKEEEADQYGAALATKLGYNPYALCDLFDRLSNGMESGLLAKISNLKGSHKSLRERANQLRNHLEEIGHKENEKRYFSYRYQQALSPLAKETVKYSSKERSTLEEISSYQRELDQHIKLKKPLRTERFLEIMKRVSVIVRQYDISEYQLKFESSALSSEAFMQEKLLQKTPAWGEFKPKLTTDLTHLLATLSRVGIGFIPVVGSAADLYEVLSGKDFVSGESLSSHERALTAVGLIAGQGRAIKTIGSKIVKTAGAIGTEREVKEALKVAKQIKKSLPKIRVPRGEAVQELSREALIARQKVERGETLYRIGTRGKSQTGSKAQFWSLEHPKTEGFGARYGIPEENLKNPNFIEMATIKKDTVFVTRKAPPVRGNPGGLIEVVVPEGAVNIMSHTSL